MKEKIYRYFTENQPYFMAAAAMMSGNSYAMCRYILHELEENEK